MCMAHTLRVTRHTRNVMRNERQNYKLEYE